MATSHGFDDRDEELLAELKAAVTDARTVPYEVVRAAKESFTWRTIDAELEAITSCYDSAVDSDVLVRGPSILAPRSLSFDGPDLGLEIEIHARHLTGQILPPQAGIVRLRTADGSSRSAPADATGWFEFDDVKRGPQRFEVDGERCRLTTEWTLF